MKASQIREREPAVAGSFYPADAERLREELARYLSPGASNVARPKAIIAPHAGYAYSGPVAGKVYQQVACAQPPPYTRVVLVGPSHYVPFEGIAASGDDAFVTPLGRVPIDEEAVDTVRALPQVRVLEAAHDREHSLEVHLPFLQTVLGSFRLVPLVVGDAKAWTVADVLESLWGGPETLIVVSSDLSHYHPYEEARVADWETADAILAMRPERLADWRACGCRAIQGLLLTARAHGLHPRLVDLRNSGDVAGSMAEVVGYGAFTFDEDAA